MGLIDLLICWLRRLWARLRYPKKHPNPPWRYDAKCRRWILIDSEGPENSGRGTGTKGFTCAEFVRAKIESSPDGGFLDGVPRWGLNSSELTTEQLVGWLGRNGFRSQNCRCGCCRRKQVICVVLILHADGVTIDHTMIFDPATCDWAGKHSGAGKERFIERFLDADDYIACGAGKPGAAPLTMQFWCKDGPAPRSRRDTSLHGAAHRVP